MQQECKLIKMGVIQDSPYLSVGDTVIGTFVEYPTKGYSFIVYENGLRNFHTSIVQSIDVASNGVITFKTLNSIYKLLTPDVERDIKLEDLLNNVFYND